ncbi:MULTISPECIES: MBL fold metallo-hydrolase [Oceanobacillus]|uniref:MBL fold metallo-hydrolase n=1 Tax=Oceanobacillus profundus TaxID=372463 RepID=A0A417YEJ3_9BACI|nr:MBL fold metallo-hydrolase [Oceanobacillus profundus]MBR3118088.1 MBL fold metallo-hydrolase [Oceanobacillus sp.]MCM3398943.1 MBL fold metallo-hydrolase [Oceanobacillus profundus]PAE28450.1 MBL fold metallo-hydrolase [Paenibacillus sp. 7884-2]RHW31083.1 MBL fold metallo-hydrolase [Oceanobacillus profundus]
MKEKNPIKLDDRIYLIDGFDLDVANRTGTYVIQEEALTLIETGPSPSVKYIKAGLAALGHALDEIKYIIVTHIHLDHAGGAGLLLRECPNATIIVHPRGERHLINPKKLAAGARAVYGDSFSELFDPIVPVPEDRLLVKGEGDILEIGPNCTLEFWDTPGHAKHHISIYDPISNGMFTGDTVGVRYEQLVPNGVDLFLPSTSPNHFNPNDMEASIKRIRDKNLDRIYFGHFGMTQNIEEALNQVQSWLEVFMEVGEQTVIEGKGYDVISQRLLTKIQEHLREKGIPDEHEVYILINLDLQVGSLGIIDYFKKIIQ